MIPGQTMFVRKSGQKIVYDQTVGSTDYGHIVDENGKNFPSFPVSSLLARGYWERP